MGPRGPAIPTPGRFASPGGGKAFGVTGDKVTIVVATRDRRADLERSLPHHEAAVIVVTTARPMGRPPRNFRRAAPVRG